MSGYLSGSGTATKHMHSAFSTALHNGNWKYYFTQTGRESVRSGIGAIHSIVKGVVAPVTKSILLHMWSSVQ